MNWSAIFKVLGMIWLGGALVYGTRHWLWALRQDRREGKLSFANFAPTFLGAYILYACVWPAGFIRDVEIFLPRILVVLGLRPAWSVLNPGEGISETWTLTDGRELMVSAIGLTPDEAVSITVDAVVDSVEVRVLQTNPETKEAIKWRKMGTMSRRDWEETIESEEELDAPRPFEMNRKLDRGRYLVEFRVQNVKGEYEVFSGIPMVVW